jgi:membrane protein
MSENSSHGKSSDFFHSLGNIWNQVVADDLVDLAAQISFYFVLSLFPFFLVMAAVVGSLPMTKLWPSFVAWIVVYLPSESRDFIFHLISNLGDGTTGVLSFGLLTTVWSASAGFVSLMESLTTAYGSVDTRSYWRKHALAVFFTFLSAIFVLACFGVMTIGRWGATQFQAFSWEAQIPNVIWNIARWTATLALMCLGVGAVNYMLPAVKRPWRWMSDGTAFAVVSLVLAIAGLNIYVRRFSSYPTVYGTLGGFIVLVLWIYIASLILLVGAEIDREIELARQEIQS